ncbi:MAG: acyltransferase [Pseudomonadota bacterium]
MPGTPSSAFPPAPITGRMDVLDGLRGIAALAVVAYHFLARWAEPQFEQTLYYHGDAFADFFPLQIAGRFGVCLFFLISGYVIMMTLERARGLIDFAGKRAARLWPAMLFCATASTLIIDLSGTAYAYPGVERWHVTAWEYVSSVFFVPPDLSAELFGYTQSDRPRWVEGVYWTLWAEVRFYALIALAWWLSPRDRFIWVWCAIQGASTLTGFLMHMGVDGFALGAANLMFQPGELAWFTLGLVAWKFRSAVNIWPLYLVSGVAVFALLEGYVIDFNQGWPTLDDNAMGALKLYACVALPFVLFLRGSRLLKPLTWKPLIAVGLASYPLYLFHERPGMAYMHWLNEAGVHPWIGVTIAFAVTVVTALLIHRYIEEPGKNGMLGLWKPVSERLERRFPRLKFKTA